MLRICDFCFKQFDDNGFFCMSLVGGVKDRNVDPLEAAFLVTCQNCTSQGYNRPLE
jgi:hypothetical protein